MHFSASRCVIVGSLGEIGRALAAELLAADACVYLVTDDAAELDEIDMSGLRVVITNVTTASGRRKLLRDIRHPSHVVVLPRAYQPAPLAEVTARTWRQAFAPNAQTTFFLLRDLCGELPRGGAAVVVTSVAAKTGRSPEVAINAAADAAVLSLVRSFANVYASAGIRVNAISTGIIATYENDQYLEKVAAGRGISTETLASQRNAFVPMGRAGTAAECSRVIRFLLSEDASFVTGQALNVTGGFHNY